MVRVLIALRRTILRNQLARTNPAMLLAGAGLVLLSAVGTIWLGLVRVPDAGGRHRRARAGVPALGGRPGRAERARGRRRAAAGAVQPAAADRRRLARSLLVVGLLDPAGVFMAIAFWRAHRARRRAWARPRPPSPCWPCILSLALASVLSTIAGAVLGPGSRRGHDVGTIVTAVALSVVAVAATLLPALDTALRRGSVPWLADALTWLPTGWGPVAVQAAARGDWLRRLGSLAGLAVLTVAAAAVVAGRPDQADGRGGAARPRGAARGRAAGRRCPAPRPARSPPRRSGCGCATRSG